MEVKILFVLIGVICALSKSAYCLRISHQNNIWEGESAPIDILDEEFYQDLPTGPEKLPIEIFEFNKNDLEEAPETEKEKLTESLVDEDTIRNAEKAADKDLLNGLNRILKNNETLKDVFRTENVYEIP